MFNRYQLSEEEHVALIEKVFANQIDIKQLRSFGSNIFYIKDYRPPFSIVIKFSDFDCKVEIRLKTPNPIELRDLADLLKEDEPNLFRGGARALRKAMREYKGQKFGSKYTQECDRYCEVFQYCDGNKNVADSLSNTDNFKEQKNTAYEPENQ